MHIGSVILFSLLHILPEPFIFYVNPIFFTAFLIPVLHKGVLGFVLFLTLLLLLLFKNASCASLFFGPLYSSPPFAFFTMHTMQLSSLITSVQRFFSVIQPLTWFSYQIFNHGLIFSFWLMLNSACFLATP